MTNREIVFENLKNPLLLFGERDQNIRFLEKEFLVTIFPKGDGVKIQGEEEDVRLVEKTLNYLFSESQKGRNLKEDELKIIAHQLKEDEHFQAENLNEEEIYFPKTGKLIKPKTSNQADYIKAIKENDLVFGIGPAGTGKTFLAVAMGLLALIQNKVQRLILTRPVVEAGESLGYLPGDLQQKINPYLRPLFDAIHDMIPYEDFVKLKERERIEIAPLAYMRGRTLNHAFTILDEAQNTTKGQLKMFLTRLGPVSKTVITGDLSQIDLPNKHDSGLILASHILKDVNGIEFTQFSPRDIIRHSLVRKIVKAFDKYEKNKEHAN